MPSRSINLKNESPTKEINFDEVYKNTSNSSYTDISDELSIDEQKITDRKSSSNNTCYKIIAKLFKIPFSARQLAVIVLLCYGNFCVGSAYSLLAPFFPTEVRLL